MSAITGVQLIYRLTNTVRLLIDERPSPVEAFSLKNSVNVGGPFVEFKKVQNKGSVEPQIRGRIMVEVIPQSVVGWDNNLTNYITLHEIIGGVEQAAEGPMVVPVIYQFNKGDVSIESVVINGFNSSEQKFVPIAVDTNGKVILAP